ncbi:response regulator [Lysinibacillus endophyticus]|uniref:Transcriptional regulatory protein n=1 Tax=Ureibacillus endophyticus TaxID=1978490 RepID=A0A494YTP9_9BACL|nr:response regulator [Lysinibacillus endophyticus]MCP1145661.1 response regulator [Lysinibacillus endophyticus]RKQ13510.1 response regulator [Lysinibacillus endophyticus]
MPTMSVYIVEDDPMVLEVNKNFLNKLVNFKLIGESQTGEQAFKQITMLKPDLVLLDMYLPDISGIDLFLKLRNERIPCDVIMITAARDAKTVQEALRMGAVDYLVKPFRFERFEKALQNYYQTSRKISSSSTLAQEEIDQLLGNENEQITSLPKGLNDITMKQILDGLLEIDDPITSEQLAQNVGMARVTVRKYLDFLANKGKVHIDLRYGSVGRPTKYYSLK